MSMSPIQRLIDALQVALISAETLDRHVSGLSAESQDLVAAVKQAGRCAHGLRTEKGGD